MNQSEESLGALWDIKRNNLWFLESQKQKRRGKKNAISWVQAHKLRKNRSLLSKVVKVFPLDCCNEVMKVNYFWREKWVFDLYFTPKPKGCRWIIFWKQDQKTVKKQPKKLPGNSWCWQRKEIFSYLFILSKESRFPDSQDSLWYRQTRFLSSYLISLIFEPSVSSSENHFKR